MRFTFLLLNSECFSEFQSIKQLHWNDKKNEKKKWNEQFFTENLSKQKENPV